MKPDYAELLLCLRLAAQLPCDPRHRRTLEQAAEAIDWLTAHAIALQAALNEAQALRDEYYSRLVGLLWAGAMDNMTGDDARKWRDEFKAALDEVKRFAKIKEPK